MHNRDIPRGTLVLLILQARGVVPDGLRCNAECNGNIRVLHFLHNGNVLLRCC